MNRIVLFVKHCKDLIFDRGTASGWDGDEILKRLINATILGILGIVLFSIAFSPLGFIKIASTALMLAGAAFISGAFLGFLFGIPRTNPDESNAVSTGTTTTDTTANGVKAYKPNTNLEQISDWLTKILVGVGLTQINSITAWFHSLIRFYAPAIGNNPALVSTIIIYFLVSGFMLGFLWSRLYMATAIIKAEAAAIEERIVEKMQTEVREKQRWDAKALSVVNQQLDPDSSIDPLPQDMMNDIVMKASPAVKVTIFNQAQSFRQEHWRRNPSKISRVIPIFKALVHCDTDNKYHRNHGQLGYALKDKTNPDYTEAEKELTLAIDIRNKAGKQSKWLLYEFNRALCRITINNAAAEEVFSAEAIENDLSRASQVTSIKEIIDREDIFTKWRAQRGQ